MKRFLLTLTVLFSAIFSLVAKPAPTDFSEKVHIGVHSEIPPLHQVDQSTSVELHWVTQENYKNRTPLNKGFIEKSSKLGLFFCI